MFDLEWRLRVFELFGGDLDPTEGEQAATPTKNIPRTGKLQLPSPGSVSGLPEWPGEGLLRETHR